MPIGVARKDIARVEKVPGFGFLRGRAVIKNW